VAVSVIAYDAQDRSLAVMPLIVLSDGCDIYGAFYTTADGRSHHSTGSTIAQVAHAQGVGQSYWTTDLTLTNPTNGGDYTAVQHATRS
jgi:hypothetical protein